MALLTFARQALGVGALAGLGAAIGAIQWHWLDRYPGPSLLALGCLAIASWLLLAASSRSRIQEGAETGAGTWVKGVEVGAFLVALGVGAFFRLRYLDTVPAGWSAEPMAFVKFARHLVDSGFPYEPYSWYAHTLYSYGIAVAMLLVADELWAFRLASAAISLATLVTVGAAARSLFGGRVAVLATMLLASSYWHFFASRNGYHQQLLPLFQALFLLGLGDAVLHGRRGGWVVAAAAMVLGLHSHWGFYLMPVFWLLGWVYLFLWWRPLWREVLRPTAIALLMTFVWASPLLLFFAYNLHTFDYVLRGFSPAASAAPDLGAKLAANLHYLLWALSGNPRAPIEHHSQLDPLVSSFLVVGIGVALRRWRSIPHAWILLLLVVNVLGLSITMANLFYLTATLVPVYLLAAIGIDALLLAARRIHRLALGMSGIALVPLFAWQVDLNYDEIFGKRIVSELRGPSQPPGSYFVLLDAVRHGMRQHAVFVARDDPGRDFDEPLMELAAQLPSLRFALDTHPFGPETILFPAALLGDKEGVEIWLPNQPYVTTRVLPLLRDLYPSLVAELVPLPPPYAELEATPGAYHLFLRREAVVAFHGLAKGEGFLFVPADGAYRLRASAPPSSLRLHDHMVAWAGKTSEALLLEAGLHPMLLAGSAADLEIEIPAGGWRPLAAYLLHRNGHAPESFSPYHASLGQYADFAYLLRSTQPSRQAVGAVEIEEDGGYWTASATATCRHRADGGIELEVPVPSPVAESPCLLARTGSGLLRLEADGRWSEITPDGAIPRGQVDCPVVELLAMAEDLALCQNGELRSLRTARVLGSGDESAKLADAARLGERVVVVDAAGARLRSLDALSGQPANEGRALSGLYWGSQVESDDVGNLYVKRWKRGIRAYAPNGNLLFHRQSGHPSIFLRSPEKDLDANALRHLRLRGAHAIALGEHDFVYKLERVATQP